jgi:tetratricopeptide (TPR) repeat protein
MKNYYYSLIFLVLITISVFCIVSLSLYAETPEELYNNANMHFRQGEYPQAIEKYESILKNGIENPDLFFNLANAYFRAGNKGKAIQFYEKAFRLTPRDTEISTNLDLAQQFIEDKIIIPHQNIFERILIKYYNFFSLRELAFITSIFFGSGFLLFFLMVLSNSRNTWFFCVSIGVLLMFIMSIFLITTLVKVKEYKSEEYGIILSDKIDVKSGTQDTYTTVFTLHEGTKVQIRESRDNWYFISLPNGMNGWIPENIDNRQTLGLI